MIMIVISFALVKFYAFAILYVLIVMQIKLVVVVVVDRSHALKEPKLEFA